MGQQASSLPACWPISADPFHRQRRHERTRRPRHLLPDALAWVMQRATGLGLAAGICRAGRAADERSALSLALAPTGGVGSSLPVAIGAHLCCNSDPLANSATSRCCPTPLTPAFAVSSARFARLAWTTCCSTSAPIAVAALCHARFARPGAGTARPGWASARPRSKSPTNRWTRRPTRYLPQRFAACGPKTAEAGQAQCQVTDAYLAALARHHGGKLVTFDSGLAALHADVAVGLRANPTSAQT